MFRTPLCPSSGVQSCTQLHMVFKSAENHMQLCTVRCTGRPPTECDDTRCCI